jgi:hypothetical protein
MSRNGAHDPRLAARVLAIQEESAVLAKQARWAVDLSLWRCRRAEAGLDETYRLLNQCQTNGGSQHYQAIIGEVVANALEAQMSLDPGEGINRDLSDE